MKIGFMELLLVFVVALLVLGPEKLPSFAKKLGAGLREFRKASGELTKELKENVIDPLEEAQQPLREAMKPLDDLDQEVNANLKDVSKSLENIGKAKPTQPKQTKAPEAVAAEAPAEADLPSEDDAVPAPQEQAEAPNQPNTENGGTTV